MFFDKKVKKVKKILDFAVDIKIKQIHSFPKGPVISPDTLSNPYVQERVYERR